MLANIVAPYVNWAPFLLRLALGVVLVYHGRPKLFGPEPGLKGFSGWLGSLGFPVPMFWALVVAVVEFFGGLGLIAGLATRWIALFVAIQFLAILIFVKKGSAWKDMELDLLIFASSVALMILGSGNISLAYWVNIYLK